MTNSVRPAYPGAWEPVEWRMAVWGQVGDLEMSRISNCLSLPGSHRVRGFPHDTLSMKMPLSSECLSHQPRDRVVGAHREVRGGEWRAFARTVYASDQRACTRSILI